jgi:hypothetical protein
MRWMSGPLRTRNVHISSTSERSWLNTIPHPNQYVSVCGGSILKDPAQSFHVTSHCNGTFRFLTDWGQFLGLTNDNDVLAERPFPIGIPMTHIHAMSDVYREAAFRRASPLIGFGCILIFLPVCHVQISL